MIHNFAAALHAVENSSNAEGLLGLAKEFEEETRGVEFTSAVAAAKREIAWYAAQRAVRLSLGTA